MFFFFKLANLMNLSRLSMKRLLFFGEESIANDIWVICFFCMTGVDIKYCICQINDPLIWNLEINS